jgi:hypothetical protein
MSVTKVTDAMRNVTTVDGTKISGAVPSGALTNVDLSKLEYNQAILAFKVASANQLAKFSMVDQVIDEYQDATGIVEGDSTNELLSGSGTAKYYEGGTSTTPTVTEDADATGTEGDYTWYKWTDTAATGSFSIDVTQAVEYLIVGGGGSGCLGNGGGGGAGGYLANNSAALSLTGGNTYTITVGAGGASVTSNGSGNVGSASVMSGTGISTLTADGGGYGGYNAVGGAGGSGGGGAYSGYAGGAATGNGLGYAGGSGLSSNPVFGGGGGGGASAVGGTATSSQAGDGGIGLQNDITGTNTWYAGGGGGAADNLTASSGNQSAGAHGGTQGGGGKGSSRDESTSTTYNDATANTGGGGGGAYNGTYNSGDGGSGIVVIRKITSIITTGANLTLQSVATTAESAPTTADLVVLIEDGAGTATVNTDIKGFVSRDGTAFSTEVTFVDEGDWGTNKRILVARNIDISGITTGTAMKYKLTTHNQSASSKETRIHATSLAWA